jgi:urease accessory protein
MPKFSGHIALRAERGDAGKTWIARQSFCAPFHLSKSYWDDQALIVQIVNPTAGILSGDTLDAKIEVGEKAALLVTTPSATRVFHMKDGMATCRQHLCVAQEGWLEFWPEPLTLHQHSRYRQTTTIEADSGAEFFYGDFLLPGRIARGEAWAWDELRLELQVKIGGELVLKERLEQSGAGLKRLATWARAGEGAGFGNLVVASQHIQDSATWVTQINALQTNNLSIGVSRVRGVAPAYSIKFIAADGQGLRSILKNIRQILRPHLPRLASDPRKL